MLNNRNYILWTSKSYDIDGSTSHIGRIFYGKSGPDVYVGNGIIKFNGKELNIYDSLSTARYGGLTIQTNKGQIRLCWSGSPYVAVFWRESLSSEFGGGDIYPCRTRWVYTHGCTKWTSLRKFIYTSYSTTYSVSYTMGGAMTTYQVDEPLTKVALPDGSYYYSMRAIKVTSMIFNSKSGSQIAGGYTTVKEAKGSDWTNLLNRIKGKSFNEIREIAKYLIVDPFGTGRIIDVRNDTVNYLDESDYKDWDIPITFTISN